MLEEILEILKGAAVALGWMKQSEDQKTGVALEEGQINKDELQAIRDQRARAGNDALAERVSTDHGITTRP